MEKFNKLLARAPGAFGPWGFEDKAAQSSVADNPDEYQFETDFARLAYMFLQDRAQPLMRFLLGFEIVSKNDDGSRAVGLFGFKVAEEYFFIPAFFLRNQVKGMDMIFAKGTNMFQPLQEDVVNNIVNRQTIELGGPAEGETGKARDFERPDFSGLIEPPTGQQSRFKFAEYAAPEAGEWEKYSEAYRHVVGSIMDALDKDASFQEDWASIVCKIRGVALPFTKRATDSKLLSYITRSGGPRARMSLFNKLGTDVDFANAALSFYPDVKSLWVDDEKFGDRFTKKAASIRIVMMGSGIGNTTASDADTKKRIVRDGFAIVDDRPDEYKTESFDVDYEKRFSSPDKNGKYPILLRSGKVSECYVLTVHGTGTRLLLSTNLANNVLAKQPAVYTRDGGNADENVDDLFKKGIKLDSVETGSTYVFMSPEGVCLPPATVRSTVTGDDTRTCFNVSYKGVYDVVERDSDPQYGSDLSLGLRSQGFNDTDFPDTLEVSETMTRLSAGTLPRDGSPLVIPGTWKAIKLKSDEDEYGVAHRAAVASFVPGMPSDAAFGLDKAAFHKLTVSSDDGLEYYFRVDGGPATRPHLYKSAYISLVKDLGLHVDDAEDMLKEAVSSYKSRRLVRFSKEAQGVGVSMPQPQEQGASVDPYTGVPMYDMEQQQSLQGEMTGLPGMPDPNAIGRGDAGEMDGGPGGGEEEIDPGAVGLANQAAEMGQRNVFDLATVGGLAKTYDVGGVIDSYMPEFAQTIDKLGRILFLYYWKGEEFAERYGTDTMVEIEDTLRSVFKGFGELTMLLREKSINSTDAASIEM